MAQLVPNNNIYQAGASVATYYIIPSKLTYSNASVTTSGSSWVEKSNIEILLTDTESQQNIHMYNEHVWGFDIQAVPSGDSYYNQSWSNHTITLVFHEAAQHITQGTLHDLTIQISNISAGTRSSYSRYIPVINLTDSTASGYETGFWIQSLTQRFSGDNESGDRRLVGVSARITFSISNTTSSSETFAYPFNDIDMLYDVNTGSDTGSSRVRNESVDLVSGFNNDVYVVNPTGGHWLTIDSNNKIYRRDDTTPPVDDPDGSHTSIVCILNADSSVVDWAGSVCSTSLLGEGIPVYTISTDPNGGKIQAYNQSGTPYWTTATQYLYKVSGRTLQIPYTTNSFQRSGYDFIGLSTQSVSPSSISIPPFNYTTDADAAYYAIWDLKSPIHIMTSTGWQQYRPSDPSGGQGYVWRAQHGADPNNPDMSQPLAWHLVKPIYVCKTVDGVKQWVKCEDVL